jgi:hypothetical protein
MAPKAEEALRKQKEAKQKLLLLALAPVLLGLLAWQGPKTYKALTGGNAQPPPTVTTIAPTTTGSTSTTATPTPSGVTGAIGLPDSDPLQTPGLGQLVVFNRFVSKDPFRSKPTVSTSTDGPTGAASAASLEINGKSENVKVGDTFPAADPAFRLVEINGQSADIGLVSGTFANGQETLAIKVGEALVLISDPDGTRYAIKLLGVA